MRDPSFLVFPIPFETASGVEMVGRKSSNELIEYGYYDPIAADKGLL